MNDNKMLGRNIRATRKSLGLTIDEVAQMVGLKRPSLNQIELGQRGCSIEILIEIARALSVTVSSLLEGDESGDGEKAELPPQVLSGEYPPYDPGLAGGLPEGADEAAVAAAYERRAERLLEWAAWVKGGRKPTRKELDRLILIVEAAVKDL